MQVIDRQLDLFPVEEVPDTFEINTLRLICYVAMLCTLEYLGSDGLRIYMDFASYDGVYIERLNEQEVYKFLGYAKFKPEYVEEVYETFPCSVVPLGTYVKMK